MKKYNCKKMSITTMVVMMMCLFLLSIGMVIAATIAQLPMNEGSGGIVRDSTGVNNGTINGAAWVDGALHFDGVSNNVTIKDNLSLNPTNSINVTVWIKLDAGAVSDPDSYFPGYVNILSKEGYASGYALGFTGGGYIHAYLRTAGGGGGYIDPWEPVGYNFAYRPFDTNWHKITMTYDGATLILKWDDIVVGSRAVTGNIAANTNDLRLGSFSSWGDSRYFTGSIKDVTISDNAVAPVTNTIAQLLMNEGSGSVIKDSIGVNSGTINGAEWVDGALHFDGVSNNVTIKNNVSLNPTSSLNLETWIKLDNGNVGFPTWANVVSKEGPGSGYGLIFLFGHIGAYITTTDNGGAYVAITEVANYIPQTYDNNWHKAGMYYDGTTFTLKWDDVIIGSRPMTGNIVSSGTDLRLGSMSTWFDDRYFQGSIKAITISDNTVVPEPTSRWLMNEGSGSIINDLQGISNGTINEASWLDDGSLHFDGINDNVNVGNNESLNPTSTLNIESWIKLDPGYPEWMNIVNKEGEYSGYYLGFVYGQLACGINTDTGYYSIDVSGRGPGEPNEGYVVPTLDTTNWHKVGMSYDGSTLSLKYDNTLVLSKPASGNIKPNSNDLRLGSMSSWLDMRYFMGCIRATTISGTSNPVSPSISGTVDLLDFSGDKTLVTGTVNLSGTDYPLILDADGKFTINGIASGSYDVLIKASHWLAKVTIDVVVGTGNSNMGIVSLINGDVVESNEVDFDDINATRSAYGSFPGDDNWNERADVDGSGEVDFTDINIVRGNYGEIGD